MPETRRCGTRLRRLAAAVLAASLAAAAMADEPPAAGQLTDPVACPGYPGQSYALYLPSAYTPKRSWPVLYLFDARQRGGMAAELFRPAAERLGVIVVSSNNARSDEKSDPNDAAMIAMWEDSHARFAIDPRRVYASGFSGGARAAVRLATVRAGEVAGVIGAGGGFPFGLSPSATPPFAFIGLAGTADFNFGELRDLDRALAGLGRRHRLETYPGPHDWCPAETCGDALEWMRSGEMRDGSAPRDETFLAARLERAIDRATELEGSGDLAGAERRLAAGIAELQGLIDVAPVEAALARLREDPATAAADAALARAQREREEYLGRVGDLLPRQLSLPPGVWRIEKVAERLELPRLLAARDRGATLYERQGAAQTLATLGVQTAFYMPRELEEKSQYLAASRCLEIATEIRPDSPGLWFEMARLRALAGETRAAVQALETAVDRGLRDVSRIENEPAFARLRHLHGYHELVEKARAAAPAAGSRTED